jgi:hypothetical protein
MKVETDEEIMKKKEALREKYHAESFALMDK